MLSEIYLRFLIIIRVYVVELASHENLEFPMHLIWNIMHENRARYRMEIMRKVLLLNQWWGKVKFVIRFKRIA